MLRRNDLDSWDPVTRLQVFTTRLQVQPNQMSSLNDHLATPSIFFAIIITELDDEVLQARELANQGYELVDMRVAKVERETLDGLESLGGAGEDEATNIVRLDGVEVDHIGSVVEEDLALEAELVVLECQFAGLAADVKKSWLRVATDEGVITFTLRTVASWHLGRTPELEPCDGDFFHFHARVNAILESELPDNKT